MIDYTNKVVYMNNKLYKVLKTYEGDEDLSFHGSPWYETFIEVIDLETNKIKVFGDRTNKWYVADEYIKKIETQLEKVKEIVR